MVNFLLQVLYCNFGAYVEYFSFECDPFDPSKIVDHLSFCHLCCLMSAFKVTACQVMGRKRETASSYKTAYMQKDSLDYLSDCLMLIECLFRIFILFATFWVSVQDR